MPWRPQQHRPNGVATKRTPHTKTTGQRGYDYRWQQASTAHREANPLCAECLRHDKITPAECVDHIRPHRGDKRWFWDTDNWQSLCNQCHKRKTQMEANLDTHSRTVVCGPPGSGKSTYVNERRKPGDLVWDWDEVVRTMTGLPMHETPRDIVPLMDAIAVTLCLEVAAMPPQRRVWIILSDVGRARAAAERMSGQCVEMGARRGGGGGQIVAAHRP